MYLFGHFVNTYCIILPLMLLASCILGKLRCSAFSITYGKALAATFLTLLFSFIGAKALYVLENPGEALRLSGVSLFGAIFFIPLLFLPASRILHTAYQNLMDFIAPYVPMTLALVRLGCFISGCGGGRWMMVGGRPYKPPVQLIESFFQLVFCCILLKREGRGSLRRGDQYPIYLLLYAPLRFILEFFRVSEPVFFSLTGAQWLSVLAFLLAIFMLGYDRK